MRNLQKTRTKERRWHERRKEMTLTNIFDSWMLSNCCCMIMALMHSYQHTQFYKPFARIYSSVTCLGKYYANTVAGDTYTIPPPCPSCWILLVACSVLGCLTSASLLSILCSMKWVTVPDDKPTTLLRCAVLASHISPSQQHQTVSTLIINPSRMLTVPSALVELHLPLPALRWLNGLNTCIHIHF